MHTQNSERIHIESLLNDLKKQKPFSFEKISASKKHGVYLINDSDGRVLHVGRTVTAKNGLNQRLSNHRNGKSSFVKNYLKGDVEKLRCNFTFQYIEVEDDRSRALLEYLSIAWFCPIHLGLGRVSEN
jgi:excinuclease UvrABC nuclease subunit